MMRKLLTMKGCWYFNRNDWQEISDFMTGKTTGTPGTDPSDRNTHLPP